jgi:GNAT superfamily N-acetyltransferase
LSIKIDLNSVVVRKLTLEDDTASFSCDQADLDEYIWYQASEQQLDGAAVVYLFQFQTQIVGFLSLNMSSIKAEHVAEEHRPEHTPYLYFPSLMVGRLATDKRFFRQGVGRLMCQFAVATAVRMRKHAGCQFVTLNAKPDSISFYQNCGFKLGENQPPNRREPFMYFKLPPDST